MSNRSLDLSRLLAETAAPEVHDPVPPETRPPATLWRALCLGRLSLNLRRGEPTISCSTGGEAHFGFDHDNVARFGLALIRTRNPNEQWRPEELAVYQEMTGTAPPQAFSTLVVSYEGPRQPIRHSYAVGGTGVLLQDVRFTQLDEYSQDFLREYFGASALPD